MQLYIDFLLSVELNTNKYVYQVKYYLDYYVYFCIICYKGSNGIYAIKLQIILFCLNSSSWEILCVLLIYLSIYLNPC